MIAETRPNIAFSVCHGFAGSGWNRDISGLMRTRRTPRPIATLWQLVWDDERLCCAVYRSHRGLELRLESGTRTLLSEPFELQPRMVSRTEALKRSLKRRGWREEGSTAAG
jgi:hypothetical protein